MVMYAYYCNIYRIIYIVINLCAGSSKSLDSADITKGIHIFKWNNSCLMNDIVQICKKNSKALRFSLI